MLQHNNNNNNTNLKFLKMSRRDNRKQFKTMFRYDGAGRIVPGSNILKTGQKPKKGNWGTKEAYQCCNTTPS